MSRAILCGKSMTIVLCLHHTEPLCYLPHIEVPLTYILPHEKKTESATHGSALFPTEDEGFRPPGVPQKPSHPKRIELPSNTFHRSAVSTPDFTSAA